MPAVICNTPACLIPKELFKEEKIQEYWSVLYALSSLENIGKDDLENYFLIYPKPNEEDVMHEIRYMYNQLKEKYPHHACSLIINVYDDRFNILALKDEDIVYSGNFCFSVKEDILYHLTNISQQFYENIDQVIIFYQQLNSDILRLLNQYYEVKQL
jgi:hypothetical protein